MISKTVAAWRFVKSLSRDHLLLSRDCMVNSYLSSRTKGLRIDPRAIIRVGKNCRIDLAENVSIGAFTVIVIDGDPMCSEGAATLLRVGRDTYIGEQNNIRASGLTVIGQKCLISQGVSIIAANHDIRAA